MPLPALATEAMLPVELAHTAGPVVMVALGTAAMGITLAGDVALHPPLLDTMTPRVTDPDLVAV